jgi:hypothetical protein
MGGKSGAEQGSLRPHPGLSVDGTPRCGVCVQGVAAQHRGLVGDEQEASTVEADRTMVRLDHPLYGEVRLAGLGTLRARRLRGAIATALAQLTVSGLAKSIGAEVHMPCVAKGVDRRC